MSLIEFEFERESNPVDMVENVAAHNQWNFERAGDEINMSVSGVWADYDVSLSWMSEFEALHMACAFDLKVPDARMNEVTVLLSKINEQLLIGHFDLWCGDGAIMFRQTLMLNGGAEANEEQLECLMSSALEACERYYQAFQYVVWAGKNANDAMAAVLFDTSGNA